MKHEKSGIEGHELEVPEMGVTSNPSLSLDENNVKERRISPGDSHGTASGSVAESGRSRLRLRDFI